MRTYLVDAYMSRLASMVMAAPRPMPISPATSKPYGAHREQVEDDLLRATTIERNETSIRTNANSRTNAK